MPISYTGSDSYNATVSIYDTTDAVLGGSTTAPACLPLVQLANRTTYLNARRIEDARAVVEASSGGRATILEDTNGNWHYMARIPRIRIADLNNCSQLCSDDSYHPATKNSSSDIGTLYVGLYPVSNTSGGDPQTVPWASPYKANMAAVQATVSNIGGPSNGWHMMSIHEWAYVSILSLAKNIRVIGAIATGGGIGQWEDSSECGYTTTVTSDSILTGSVIAEARHDHTMWGVAEMVGSEWEFVDKIKVIDRKIHFSNTNKLTDIATGTLTDQGFYIAKNVGGDLIYNTSSSTVDSNEYFDKFTAFESDPSITGVTAYQSSLISDLMLSPGWLSSSEVISLFSAGNCFGTIWGTLSAGTQYVQRGGDQDLGGQGVSGDYGLATLRTCSTAATGQFRLCYYEP